MVGRNVRLTRQLSCPNEIHKLGHLASLDRVFRELHLSSGEFTLHLVRDPFSPAIIRKQYSPEDVYNLPVEDQLRVLRDCLSRLLLFAGPFPVNLPYKIEDERSGAILEVYVGIAIEWNVAPSVNVHKNIDVVTGQAKRDQRLSHQSRMHRHRSADMVEVPLTQQERRNVGIRHVPVVGCIFFAAQSKRLQAVLIKATSLLGYRLILF